jgi:hypothetical protein
MRDKPTFSSERMLHKDYDRKCSVEKISGSESQGAWCQDEPIRGIPPVVTLTLKLNFVKINSNSMALSSYQRVCLASPTQNNRPYICAYF